MRTAWRAVVAQDILMKLLLKTRPYELEKGATDAVYHESLEDVGAAVSLRAGLAQGAHGATSPPCCAPATTFRALPADYEARGRSSAWSARSSAA